MADDDAKVAARWLGIWTEGKRCHGGSREVEWVETQTATGALSSGATVPVGPKIPCIHGEMNAHDIPPPDFTDPAVYDRALRELAERYVYLCVQLNAGRGSMWRCSISTNWTYPGGGLSVIGYSSGSPGTIGAAIAAAIAELARAEGAKDADMGPQKPANG